MPQKKRVLRTRKLSFSQGKENEKSQNESMEVIQQPPEPVTKCCDVSGKQWTLYDVSPFYGFNFAKLWQYGSKLGAALASNNYNSDTRFKAVFTVKPKLKPTVQGTNALLVEVFVNNEKCVYRGYFINWSENQKVQNEFLHFPILLVEGQMQIIQNVNKVLCKFFDCVIYQVKLTFNDILRHFTELFRTNYSHYNIKNKVVSLKYIIPGCEGRNNSITLNVSAEDLEPVLRLLLEQFHADTEITDKELFETFYERIMAHVQLTYSLNIAAIVLVRVVLPTANIMIDGKFKWLKDEMAKNALAIFQSSKQDTVGVPE